MVSLTVAMPYLFNWLIIGLYFCAAIWLGWHEKWLDSAYWVFAIGLTVIVTLK